MIVYALSSDRPSILQAWPYQKLFVHCSIFQLLYPYVFCCFWVCLLNESNVSVLTVFFICIVIVEEGDR